MMRVMLYVRLGVESNCEDTKQEDEQTNNGGRQQPSRVETLATHTHTHLYRQIRRFCVKRRRR